MEESHRSHHCINAYFPLSISLSLLLVKLSFASICFFLHYQTCSKWRPICSIDFVSFYRDNKVAQMLPNHSIFLPCLGIRYACCQNWRKGERNRWTEGPVERWRWTSSRTYLMKPFFHPRAEGSPGEGLLVVRNFSGFLFGRSNTIEECNPWVQTIFQTIF